MKQGDVEALVKAFAPVIREVVKRAVNPVIDRLRYLEAREAPQGEPGPPGKDGFDLDSFDVERGDDSRTVVLCFAQGDTVHKYEMTFPVPIYCGIFKEGQTYEPGDMVTWGGSLWHCDAETKEKPGTENWTQAVKKGRDGKDARG